MQRCKGAKLCSFDKKADGSEVNSLEIVAAKFTDLKEEFCRKQAGRGVGGTTLMI